MNIVDACTQTSNEVGASTCEEQNGSSLLKMIYLQVALTHCQMLVVQSAVQH